MLKLIKRLFKGAAKDKAAIKASVVEATTVEERSTYRIWVFLLVSTIMVGYSIVFIIGMPCFMYCAYRVYRWMRTGNTSEGK